MRGKADAHGRPRRDRHRLRCGEGGRKGVTAVPGSGDQGTLTAHESYIIPHAQGLAHGWVIRCWRWVDGQQGSDSEG